jgi:hypothetical protein
MEPRTRDNIHRSSPIVLTGQYQSNKRTSQSTRCINRIQVMPSRNNGKSHCVVAGAASEGRSGNTRERRWLKLASLRGIIQSSSGRLESVKFDTQGNGSLRIKSRNCRSLLNNNVDGNINTAWRQRTAGLNVVTNEPDTVIYGGRQWKWKRCDIQLSTNMAA